MSDKRLDEDGAIEKVRTFKSGHFVFSRLYDREKINVLELEAFLLDQTVGDLPILPRLASTLQEDLIRRSIFGTAAIEGNPLSEAKVTEIITAGSRGGPAPGSAEREIRNLKEAYDSLESLREDPDAPLLSEDRVKELHRVITQGVEHPRNVPGQYRHHLVEVGDTEHGGIYTPPKIFEDVSTLMRAYIEWINSMKAVKYTAYIRAALAHYYLALIHPFADGNGRVARLVEAHLLKVSGIDYVPVALSNYYYRHIDDYFRAFSATRKQKDHSVTPFLEFTLRAVIETLQEIRERIIHLIRKLALREHYATLKAEGNLKKREHDLLAILLDSPSAFTLGDLSHEPKFQALYGDVSERTARRDLKELCDANLLICTKDKYELNFRVIG